MNPKRIGTLFGKELRQGAKNFIFIYAIVTPLLLSLMVALLFGDLFSQTPRLGVVADTSSDVARALGQNSGLSVRRFASEASVRDAVARGQVEVALIFPPGFDEALRTGDEPELRQLRWGEAPLNSMIITQSALARAVGEVAGVEQQISVNPVALGDASTVSWTDHLLPMIVLMTIILGGILVPATSLVEEKQRRTLSALTITPATLLDVYIAKALLGVLLAMVMGLAVLVLNRALGNQPMLLAGTLLLSALVASLFGVLLGSLVHEMNMLLAVVKALGLILFAPALIQLVPNAPQWIAQLFPTFYIMEPVLAVSQNGAGLGEVWPEMAVALAMAGGLLLGIVAVLERQEQQIALAA